MDLSKNVSSIDSWFDRNAKGISRLIEIVFGIVWGIDGVLKFQPSFSQSFSALVVGAAAGQPQWLNGWFMFWGSITAVNPGFFASLIAVSEIALFISLTTGLLRKIVTIQTFS